MVTSIALHSYKFDGFITTQYHSLSAVICQYQTSAQTWVNMLWSFILTYGLP